MVRPAQPVHGADAELREPGRLLGGRRAAVRRLPGRDRPRPSRPGRGDRLPADRRRDGARGADVRAARDAGAVPEAHDPPPAPGDGPRGDGVPDPRVPGPRPGAGADVVREGPRRADPGGPRAAAAARAVRDVRRAGGRRGRRAARPARDARAAVRRARHRVLRVDARLARGAAGHRRRLGTALVRRRRGLDRLRAVLPGSGDPLPDRLAPLLERCRPYYEALAPYRLRPSEEN